MIYTHAPSLAINFIIQFNLFDTLTSSKWKNQIEVWHSLTTEELISLFSLLLMINK